MGASNSYEFVRVLVVSMSNT